MGIGILSLGLSLYCALGVVGLSTIPGPSGSPPHPDAMGGILIMAVSSVVLLLVGVRLVRKPPAQRDATSRS